MASRRKRLQCWRPTLMDRMSCAGRFKNQNFSKWNDNREISLTRDCDAIQIPSGHPIISPAGMSVIITQSLGGTYTVATPGGLAPID